MSVSELALLLQGYFMAVCTNCRTLKYMAPLHIIVLLASISCSTSIYHFYVKLYNTLKFYKSPFILASNLPQIIYHTSQLFTHFLSLLIMKIGDETKKHRQKHQQGPEPDKPNHQLSSRAVNITDCQDRLGDCMTGVVRTGHQSNTQGPLQ